MIYYELWGEYLMESLGDYYHDERMQKMFCLVEQPKNIEDIDISESFIKNLVLKIISTYGNIKVTQLHDITGLHVDILEEALHMLEKDNLCAQTGGGFLFSSVEYTIKKPGREKSLQIMHENPYIGICPVSYDEYFAIMSAQLKGRFPLKIPKPVIENALKDIVGIEEGKKTLVASSIGGTGFFIYGSPGTGKTFLTSKMSNMLPPILIPKYIEFSGSVIQLYDPDFHRKSPDQPEDPRWVKVAAPFVFTGSELTSEKLETLFNPNKGVYETSPIIKANGGILLLDDLGRQKEDHNIILNRLIVPLENKRDVIYIKGSPVIVHTQFIPILSTNLEINIVDEAHLRRAPMHIILGAPDPEEIVEVFKRNLDELGENYDDDVLERFRKVYLPIVDGGEQLTPTFAHARDIAHIAQSVRIRNNEKTLTLNVLEESLDAHILIAMQRKYTPELFERIIGKKSM
jgi:predicted ATPase with chaperone activity